MKQTYRFSFRGIGDSGAALRLFSKQTVCLLDAPARHELQAATPLVRKPIPGKTCLTWDGTGRSQVSSMSNDVNIKRRR